MIKKRFTFDSEFVMGIYDRQTGKSYDGRIRHQKRLYELLNDFDEYIKELKQEVELLREGLKTYDENLPLYLTPREIRDFNSDLFEFKIKEQNFYKEHPRLCKVIIDGKRYKDDYKTI